MNDHLVMDLMQIMLWVQKLLYDDYEPFIPYYSNDKRVSISKLGWWTLFGPIQVEVTVFQG